MPFDEYFWTLKDFFPGDPDFTFDRYPNLPYQYVLLAIRKGQKVQQTRLHNHERPMALNTALLAAQSRDPKKSKPLTWQDFCFYKPRVEGEQPNHIYGSAFMRLIEQKRLPPWALAFYKELSESAVQGYVPLDTALIAEDAILLHPMREGATAYSGLLLAQETASKRVRAFRDDQGKLLLLRCPEVDTKIVALEGAILAP